MDAVICRTVIILHQIRKASANKNVLLMRMSEMDVLLCNEEQFPKNVINHHEQTMPRYHFNLVGRSETISDPRGVDLPDDEAARKVALDVIAELRMGKAPNGEWDGWWLEIANASGAIVAGIPLSPQAMTMKTIRIERKK